MLIDIPGFPRQQILAESKDRFGSENEPARAGGERLDRLLGGQRPGNTPFGLTTRRVAGKHVAMGDEGVDQIGAVKQQ